MPVNSHVALSGTGSPRMGKPSSLPHSTAGYPMFSSTLFFFCRQILSQMIWGGVLERHPGLKVVFTEMGSGWVIHELDDMDHNYEDSYMRRDIRQVVKRK